jgi:hypothetical protein
MMNRRWFVSMGEETADAAKQGASGHKVKIQNNARQERRKHRFSKKCHAVPGV